jgi:hypothetical protein
VPTAGNIGLELSAVFLASARYKYFEMLNRSIQINVVKTTVAKSDATLMMLLEGVHRLFPRYGKRRSSLRTFVLHDYGQSASLQWPKPAKPCA